jgi:cell division protein ZapE
VAVFDTAAEQLGFTLDQSQRRAVDALSSCTSNLYLWGPVGRGKSWLMATYFAALPPKRKLRVHFHEFFRDLHRSIRLHGDLESALTSLLGDTDVVCFDEFHVHDPADGQFIGRMLPVLLAKGIRVIMTSNYSPQSLLPNPLFHDDFLPTIALIEQSLTIISVDGPVDYRTISRHDTGFAAGHWVSPGSPDQVAHLGLATPTTTENTTLTPAGHPIHARRVAHGTLWIDFHELCQTPTAPIDYLALANDFPRWVISGVPDLSAAGPEPAQRFANVIDVLYDRDVTPIFLASTTLSALTSAGPLPHDIERVTSRLGQLIRTMS